MANKFDHLFPPRSLADKVKDLGFNEPCIAVYMDNHIQNPIPGGIKITDNPKDHYYYEDSAPTYQQVVDWLRKKYKLNCVVERDGGHWFGRVQDCRMENDASPIEILIKLEDQYYKALNKTIKKALKEIQ